MNEPPVTLMVETAGGVLIQRIGAASPLRADIARGSAAEEATQDAAALWGLPDFVYRPVVLPVGSGSRELGDRLMSAAAADPLLTGLPRELVTFQWHEDTCDRPRGAVLLASSPAYPNRALRFSRAHGVRFHPEVSVEMAREWGRGVRPRGVARPYSRPGSLPGSIRENETSAAEMRSHGQAMFERWLEAAVAV